MSSKDFNVLLASLLGETSVIEEKTMMVVEVIHSESSVVLKEISSSNSHFQENQYGQSGHKVSNTYTLSLWNDTHTDLHPIIRSLLDKEIADTLKSFAPKYPYQDKQS